MQNYYYYTCESAQVLDSGGCNTAGQILVQHTEGMALSPSLTEMKESHYKVRKDDKPSSRSMKLIGVNK